MEIYESILQEIYALSIAEIGAFIFGLIYVVLAAKENVWCWAAGLVSVLLFLYIFIDIKLYSEASLQVFYIGMSLYGWYQWKYGRLKKQTESDENLNISTWKINEHAAAIFGGFVLSLVMGYLWSLTDAARPFIDSMTTSFSLIATYMTTRKVLENWIYWVVIDVVSIFLYMDRGLNLSALLFFIYTIVAIQGYLAWKKTKDNYKEDREDWEHLISE